MPDEKLPGGPTQDEILAISLHKLGLKSTDTVLEVGCGTGKVSVAIAHAVKRVVSIDLRPDAVSYATETAKADGVRNIEFFCMDAAEYIRTGEVFDCAFVGGSKHLPVMLPQLAEHVRRTIVINAVLVGTLADAVAGLKRLGLFTEVVQVQVSRSHDIAGSVMFKPIDPVWIIVGRGSACS
ncbi:methyltransferase domain-containing protein [Methanoregula sp.]|uniref:methyltransferase domain-containing protein n=1 Tax=Methanoregula sp. TaxID=2052170 RepID=UPI003C75F74E